MTEYDLEILSSLFENSHSERREIDVVQVTHFARKEVVAFRLLDAHSDVGVRNIDRTVDALAVRFPLKAEIFVIQYAFCVHTIGERAAAAADAVQLLNQRGKFGRLAFVDIADVRAEFVIPVRFVSLRAAFRTIIHAGNTRHTVQNRIHGGEFALIGERRTGADNVVIVCKIEEVFARIQAPLLLPEQAGERMFDLEQIIRIERGGEPLVALVVRDGIEPVWRQVFGKILDMDDLAHQEKVLPLRANGAAEKLEEPFGQKIGNIQPQTVDLKFIDPELDCAADVIGHRAAVQVELDELHVPFPALVPKSVVVAGIAAEIDVEPILFVAPLAAGAHVLKGEKTAADMVEYSVQYHTDSVAVKRLADFDKIIIGAKPAVKFTEISCIISMIIGLKNRIQKNGVHSKIRKIICPVEQFADTGNGLAIVVHRCTAEPDWIDLIKK